MAVGDIGPVDEAAAQSFPPHIFKCGRVSLLFEQLFNKNRTKPVREVAHAYVRRQLHDHLRSNQCPVRTSDPEQYSASM